MVDDAFKRKDGRRREELRPIAIEVNVLNRADGSAYIEWGGNKILAAVYGPREVHPRHHQRADRGIVQCRYNMAPFSVQERKRPGPDRRSIEISKVVAEALEGVVLVRRFPRTAVDIYIEVLEANAGTRCAGLTAASVALADAGVPMRGLVAACAAGKVDGHVVVDLSKEEDNDGDADLPMAVLPRTGEVLLLQMDGHLTTEELDEAIRMNMEACTAIHEMQREALKRKYDVRAGVGAGAGEDTGQVGGGDDA